MALIDSNKVEQPRRRNCGRKVKTGCRTCKVRRVKCDESRPSCEKCVSTGRQCDGYASDLARLSPEGRGQAIAKQPFTLLPGTIEERRGFQYFVSNTAAELSGYFYAGFWEHFILQASIAEPSLRHAIIGLGALHEDFSNRRYDMATKCELARTNDGFAAYQYTKAIGHLRRSLDAGKQKPLTALMSCILFVCFDSLRGHYSNALLHLQSGIKILGNSISQGSLRGDDELILNTIAPFFMRLSIQAILFIDTRPFSTRQAFSKVVNCIEYPQRNTFPVEFSDLEEARISLNRAADGIFRFNYTCDGELPFALQAAEAKAMYFQHRSELEAWIIAFENTTRREGATFNGRQLRGAALSKVHYIIVDIMVKMILPDPSESRSIRASVNDPFKLQRFDSGLQTVVDLSRSLINAADEDAKAGRPSLTFSADLGVVAPLYFVCVKSTLKATRQQAMDLLRRCPRKEGMWDSASSIKLAEQFWEAERKQAATLGKDVEEKIQMSNIVDLVLNEDNMRWEWKIRDSLKGNPKGREYSSDSPEVEDTVGSGLYSMSLV